MIAGPPLIIAPSIYTEFVFKIERSSIRHMYGYLHLMICLWILGATLKTARERFWKSASGMAKSWKR